MDLKDFFPLPQLTALDNNVMFREGSNSQSAVNEGFDDNCPIIGETTCQKLVRVVLASASE